MRVRSLLAPISLTATILLIGTAPAAIAHRVAVVVPPSEGTEGPKVRGAETPKVRTIAPHVKLTLARPEATPNGQSGSSASPQGVAVSGEPLQAEPGGVAAWGENFHGQLGQVFRDSWELSPVGVEGVASAVQLAGTGSFNLALLSNGTVLSWGGNAYGQLGDDLHRASWEQGTGHVLVEEEDPHSHAVVGALHGVKQIAAGTRHAMALMQNGTVMTWGGDLFGEMGNGTHGWERELNVNMRLPKTVPGLTGIRAIAAGGGADFALTEAGTVLAWGSNTEGQLGIGEPGPEHCETETAHYPRYQLCSSHPLPVVWRNPQTGQQEELREVAAIAASGFATYAILRDGRVVSWGSNAHGQLGTGAATWGSRESPPAELRLPNGAPLTGVAELAPGIGFALARMQNGAVLGWGSAEHGALAGAGGEYCGREVTSPRGPRHEPKPCLKRPTPVPALEALHPEALSAGHFFGLALVHGAVYAWGEDARGQLGSGSPRTKDSEPDPAGYPQPTRVAGIGPASAIDAAVNHSLALLAPGVSPPPPLVTAQPAPLALDLSWQSATSNGAEQIVAERLLFRARRIENEGEPAEQGRDEDEQGPPVNLEGEAAYIVMNNERLEGQPIVAGAVLAPEPGGWSGARPITFAYAWQRCSASGEACVNVPARKFGRYQTTAADVGHTLRAVITATGPEGSEVAYTAPTGLVLAPPEEEAGRSAASHVRLAGASFYAILGTLEKIPNGRKAPLEVLQPLQAIPYEVRLQASGRTRLMVLTPQP